MYGGRVGRAVAHRLEADGFLTAEDLARHTGGWEAPISTTYRGATIYETPPPTQRLTALQGLNLLEGFARRRSAAALRRAPASSRRDREARVRRSRPLDRRSRSRDGAGRGVALEGVRRAPPPRLRSREGAVVRLRRSRGDTTGFVVADGHGNLISVIQSLFNNFGSGVVADGTGVVLQNRGRHFSLDPAHPAAFAPGKRPSTLMASIATRDERPVLGLRRWGERSGDGSSSGADQPVRLRPGRPGGDRAPAVPHRRVPAGRSGGRDPRGIARARRESWRRSRPGATASGRRPSSSGGAVTRTGSCFATVR